MEKITPLTQLVSEAREMLMDRPQIEQDLIYAICTLKDEERVAIILAHNLIQAEKAIPYDFTDKIEKK